MKKIIIAFVVIFIANLGCKKISDGDGLCGCSPITPPSLHLVIKSAVGTDLLNTENAGAYSPNQIQLFQKDNSGAIKQLRFHIRPGFSFGSEKFNYYQLYSDEVGILAQIANQSFYLKLGDANPRELKVQLNNTTNRIEKLSIDKKDAPVETGEVSKYAGSIFYLTL